jgi:hypothetical protein
MTDEELELEVVNRIRRRECRRDDRLFYRGRTPKSFVTGLRPNRVPSDDLDEASVFKRGVDRGARGIRLM